MARAIEFDDQTRRRAVEADAKAVDGVLAADLQAELLATKCLPQAIFSRRGLMAGSTR